MNTVTHDVLVIFAHPAFQKSRVNRTLAGRVKDMEGVTFHDLYEAYPDFHIDVRHEQGLLRGHDIIVFQHPFFWFSVPALLKEWLDLVLEHGWAYGKDGSALAGKKLLSVVSTGGREELYQKDGYNRHRMEEFLNPIKQTAHVCKMDYLPPFVVHGTHMMTGETISRHADDYRRLLAALRDGRFDFESARKLPRLNADLERLITEQAG